MNRSKPRFPMLSPEDWHILLFLADLLTAAISVFLVLLSGRVLSCIVGETAVSSPWTIGILVSVSWPVILRIVVGPSVAHRGVLRTGLLIGLSAVACGGLMVAVFDLWNTPVIQRSALTCLILYLVVLGLLSRWGYTSLFGRRPVLRTVAVGPAGLFEVAASILKAEDSREFVGFLQTGDGGGDAAGQLVLGSTRQFDEVLRANAPIHSIVFLCDPESIENSREISQIALDCRIRQEHYRVALFSR